MSDGVEVLTDSPLWHVHDNDEEVHIHCCLDASRLLCGAPDTDEKVGEDVPANCATCVYLENHQPSFCPAGFVCGDLP